jgi:hypothetical protein
MLGLGSHVTRLTHILSFLDVNNNFINQKSTINKKLKLQKHKSLFNSNAIQIMKRVLSKIIGSLVSLMSSLTCMKLKL